MRAVVVEEFGGPEVMRVVQVPVPEPGPGQVRLRVAAAAVNPVDVMTRLGLLAQAGFHPVGVRTGLGWDAAGTVDAVGEGVTEYAVGDQLIGMSDRLALPTKAYAEYLVLDVGAVAPAPRGVPAEQAATLPLNAVTAWQSLDALALPPSGTVLVTGAAGGLGGLAVELAVARGLRVVAQAGEADEKAVRGFGAEFFVRRDEPLAEAVRRLVPGGVDGVLDAAGIGNEALDAARVGGAFVSLNGAGPVALRNVRVHTHHVGVDAGQLREVVRLAEAGRLSLRVADTLPLEDAAEAHRRLSAGGVRGRLVLVP
ncbi:NADP-dependent oxidoreductase [Allostreptomyces psammosilenae]|uniref:NADPH:quinone reductase-like Zn-dependent oxidoreductase n=1 Tax=Allostreptomyces psammosilenae TaxID=1892865 RepID=A0A852ZY41_9ACTN|nr:NADP-dependent oxidoreductase [Allostreptomyces psammosilenae]NYI07246.1 NADPH:quinone reductase-like Zn-dependent oxidoreductase [Allostreptomyces psammosilenae]